MDSITLNFNVDVAALQAAGVDPTTSEGKAELRALFLDALELYGPTYTMDMERLFKAKIRAREETPQRIRRVFLQDGTEEKA